MKRLWLLLLLIGLFPPPLMSDPLTFEIRGVWVESPSLLSPSLIDTTLARVQRGEFNLINAEVFTQGYALWDSSLTEKHPDVSPDFNPLEYLVEAAHDKGIRVNAWFVVAAVGLWDGGEAPVLSRHPEWALQNVCGGTCTWLDVSQKEVRAFLCSLSSEINDYNVDGIHLDYIRYPGKEWGYSPACVRAFTTRHNMDDSFLLRPTLPLYSFFEGNPLADVTTAEVLATFDNDVPAVVVNKYKGGEVVLFNWNMRLCETQAARTMMENALEYLDKETVYIFFSPETVDVYGYEPFNAVWEWAQSRNAEWLEEEWFSPDPGGVVIFPSTYYLNENVISDLGEHLREGGAAIFIDGPVFVMEYEDMHQIMGMESVGDYMVGEYVLSPVKAHEILPLAGDDVDIEEAQTVVEEWDQYRKDQVTETVRQIRGCTPKELSAAVFQNGAEADSVLQDWYHWREVDVFMPMAYVDDLNELERDLDEWRDVLGGYERILPGLSVMVWWPAEKGKDIKTVLREIESCSKRGVKGVVLFSLGNMEDALLDALARTWGPATPFDYSPPRILDVVHSGEDVVVISVETDEPTALCLVYQPGEEPEMCSTTLEARHEVTLHLNPDTFYRITLSVKDEAGNQSTKEISFTTPARTTETPSPSPVPVLGSGLILVSIALLAGAAFLFIFYLKK